MADAEIIAILFDWGLSHLNDKFHDEGIDLEACESLDDEMIKTLVPKIGDQAKFKRRYADWKEERRNNKDMQAVIFEGNLPAIPVIPQEQMDVEVPIVQDNLVQNNANDNAAIANAPPPPPIGNRVFLALDLLWTVLEVLQSSVKGRGVLASYEKSKKLTSHERNTIVSIIIEKVLTDGLAGSMALFEHLATQIVSLFPTESTSIYFLKKECKGKKYAGIKGKLKERFRNQSKFYLAHGLRDRRRRLRNALAEVQNDHLQEQDGDIVNDDAVFENVEGDELEALQWLENNIEPFQTVSEKWKATTASRLANLGRTIRSQFERFKALKQPNGYSLIEIDFSSLHPGKEGVLFNLWPNIADKLIKLVTAAKEKSLSPGVLELLRSAIQDDATQELKNLCAFLILPFICPVSRTLVANNVTWKPSASEVQRSFILLVDDATQVTEANDERRKFCQDKGLSLQPYIILVGPNLCSISARFVIIENIFYKVETILKAIDVCFKSFFVFNATYQVECEHIWLFIQRKIFDITTKYDNNFTRLEELFLKLQE